MHQQNAENNIDGDHLSFADSDQFEEDDSVCSWSENESLVNNWRGWRKNSSSPAYTSLSNASQPDQLLQLCARAVASYFPFEVVELNRQPVPEELQKLVAFYSFPTNEEDIRLYSCLAGGSPDEFNKGEQLFKQKSVKNCLQIGLHLTASVETRCLSQMNSMSVGMSNLGVGMNRASSNRTNNNQLLLNQPVSGGGYACPSSSKQNGSAAGIYKVSLGFDRRKIIKCNCTCSNGENWCAHVVAVCLYRIHEAEQVMLRAPVSESLGKLSKDDLQKFAQYLICQLQLTEILPAAQDILDKLLASTNNELKLQRGAPDPTAGGCLGDVAAWCFDEENILENVRKILGKFCVPQPVVYSDPSFLTSSLPAAAQEYQNLLRPLRGKEPEGIWNLLSIIKEMFRRRDNNSIPLLEIVTSCLLEMELVVIWWYAVRLNLSMPGKSSQNSSSAQNHHAAASFCDEMVYLWRLAALDPRLGHEQRWELKRKLMFYHEQALEKAQRGLEKMVSQRAQQSPSTGGGVISGVPGGSSRSSNRGGRGNTGGGSWQVGTWSGSVTAGSYGSSVAPDSMANFFSVENKKKFPGFKPAYICCRLTWDDYPLPGITDVSSELLISSADAHSVVQHNDDIAAASPSMTCQSTLLSNSSATKQVGGNTSKRSGRRSRNASTRESRINSACCPSLIPTASSNRKSSTEVADSFLEDSKSEPRDRDESVSQSCTVSSLCTGNSSTTRLLQEAAEGLQAAVVSDSTNWRPSSKDRGSPNTDGGASSSSSEGFCESIGGDSGVLGAPTRGNKSSVNMSTSQLTESGNEPPICISDSSVILPDLSVITLEEDSLLQDTPRTLLEDSQEILFARCQALYFHGYPKEAARLAIQIAHQMLANKDEKYKASRSSFIHMLQTGLVPSVSSSSGRSGRRQRGSTNHQTQAHTTNTNISSGGTFSKHQTDYAQMASTIITHTLFLIACLLEDSSANADLSLQLCLYALCFPRPPAREKTLEVKLFHQEMELLVAMRKIPLSTVTLQLLRIKATDLLPAHKLQYNQQSGSLPDAHIPYSLAFYLFEQLTLPSLNNNNNSASFGLTSSGNNSMIINSNTTSNLGSITYSSFFSGLGNAQGWSFSSGIASTNNRSGTTANFNISTNNPNRALFTESNNNNERRFSGQDLCTAEDAELGFEVAVGILGLRNPLPEQHFSLLVEGQRKQRYELAALLFVIYKEELGALTKILDQLLDRRINSHFKVPPLDVCISTPVSELMHYRASLTPTTSTTHTTVSSSASSPCTSTSSKFSQLCGSPVTQLTSSSMTVGSASAQTSSCVDTPPLIVSTAANSMKVPSSSSSANHIPVTSSSTEPDYYQDNNPSVKCGDFKSQKGSASYVGSSKSCVSYRKPLETSGSRDTDSSALEDEPETLAATKAWEEKFRCTQLKSSRKIYGHHSVGMAAIDSSAPETTSSDNSPTTARRNIMNRTSMNNTAALHQQDSDSSCGGHSSDSDGKARRLNQSPNPSRFQPSSENVESSSIVQPPSTDKQKPTSGPVNPAARNASNSTGATKILLNQTNRPSESMAHHMFDLAQTLLVRAGASNSSVPVFVANAFSIAYRHLQLCAFQIGLYALGLYNMLNPSWQSRTYSSHVAWISNQVMENGVVAACILLNTWKHHLNPAEVAGIADKASRDRDPHMVMVAAELCLACLSECSTLNHKEITRALQQCKEQSNDMLERGLLSVENGANKSLSGGVMPEIFFDLAHCWFQLYESISISSSSSSASSSSNTITSSAGHQHIRSTSVSQMVTTQPNLFTMPVQALNPLQFTYGHQISACTQNAPSLYNMASIGHTFSSAANTNVALYQQGQMLPSPQSTNQQSPANVPGPAGIYPAANNFYNFMPQTNGPQIGFYPQQSQFLPVRPIAFPGTVAGPTVNIPIRPNPLLTAPMNQSGGALYTSLNHPQFTGFSPMPVQPSTAVLGVRPQHQGPARPHLVYQQQSQAEERCATYLSKAFQCAIRAIKVVYQPQKGRSSDVMLSANRDLPRISTPIQHCNEIKWTFHIAKLLGMAAVQEYCNTVVLCIQDQYLMREIARKVIELYDQQQQQLLALSSDRNSLSHHSAPPAPVVVASPPGMTLSQEVVNKIINKVHLLFRRDIENRLQHIGQGQSEWDELVDVILNAQETYMEMSSSEQGLTWNNLLQRIQRHHKCKSELWQRILAGINTRNLIARN